MENLASGFSILASILSIIATVVSVRALIVAKGNIKVKGDSNQITMKVSSSSDGEND